jgi:hypothetical protein
MADKILKAGATLLSPIGSILGLGDKKAAPAAVPAPAAAPRVMPLADDEAVKRARKASIVRQQQRGGRASTILTGGSEKLGG